MPEQKCYNGIQLPVDWPPRQQALSREPMPVPYLEAPLTVIPTDMGRQESNRSTAPK